jgi:hypothetical protein
MITLVPDDRNPLAKTGLRGELALLRREAKRLESEEKALVREREKLEVKIWRLQEKRSRKLAKASEVLLQLARLENLDLNV